MMSILWSRALRAPVLKQNLTISRSAGRTRWVSKRSFIATPRAGIAVKEMGEKDFASLRVNQQRLMDELHKTCEWGKGERWGE